MDKAPKAIEEREFTDAEITAAVEKADDEVLIAELTARGYIVADPNELDALHDAFWTRPQQAVAEVRSWLRKATGRV